MIELSPITALMLYLCATLSVLLGIWIFQHYRMRSKTILSPEKNMQVCEFCHFAYLAENTEKVTRCPRCKSFNR